MCKSMIRKIQAMLNNNKEQKKSFTKHASKKMVLSMAVLFFGYAAYARADGSMTKQFLDEVGESKAFRFTISTVELGGNTNLLSEQKRQLILDVFQNLIDKPVSTGDVLRAQEIAQIKLMGILGDKFELSVPPQKIIGGKLIVLITPKLGNITAQVDQGYDGDNLLKSLPTLKTGKLLFASNEWVDSRELYMARENPLKRTDVSYQITPDQGVDAVIKATAPFGNKYVSVGFDNYGNDVVGRGRVNFAALHGNLTGRDDVLSLVGVSSTNTLLQSYGASVSYSVPFYESHNALAFTYSHGHANVNLMPIIPGGIDSYGSSDQFSFKLTHYLKPFAWEAKNQFKLSLGFGFNDYRASSKYKSFSLQDYEVYETPLTLGISGVVTPTQGVDLDGAVNFVTAGAGLLGTSSASSLSQSREGVGSYNLFRYNLGTKAQFNRDYIINARLFGQYTKMNLIPYDAMTIAGSNGVRGFVNAVMMGDSTSVLRLEALSPKLVDSADLRLYSFYDLGRKWGGSDNANATLSSWGLGTRFSSPSNRLNLDFYVAQKLEGNHYDFNVDDHSRVISPVTYWLSGSLNY
jgi:hemolysin activation/secretion protein